MPVMGPRTQAQSELNGGYGWQMAEGNDMDAVGSGETGLTAGDDAHGGEPPLTMRRA